MDISLVTIVIIAANVIISIMGFNDYSFFERYKFHIGSIQRGERDRMFTSGFLHVDIMHLIFNMFTLVFFANEVIYQLGATKFVLIYLAALGTGNLLSLWFHKNEYNYSAVGASGAVMGILYASILLAPNRDIILLFFPIPIKGYIFGIIYLLYSIYGMKSRHDNIGHTAHFGGAIGGYILTLCFAPYLFQTDLKTVILLAIPIVVLFVLLKSGKI